MVIALPFRSVKNSRWDCVIEKDGLLNRVQVKTGRLRNGVIRSNCYSLHAHHGGAMRKYTGDIEYFAVHCGDVQQIYLIPIAELDVWSASLRLQPDS